MWRRRADQLRVHLRVHSHVSAAVHQPPSEERLPFAVEGNCLPSHPLKHPLLTNPNLFLFILQYLVYKFLNTFIDGKFNLLFVLSN